MNHIKALTDFTASFINEMNKSGITDVVVSPGSRSTPMAMLMAEHPNINLYINVDERSAGFFALGMAKASKKPVALLCTSGTAAANYFPAIVEAEISRVPLLVLTADRPHELRNVGAPQAIDQIHLYGQHVKWFNEMALPEEGESAMKYVTAAARRAVSTSLCKPAGPVHLNFPFREPLIPDLDSLPYQSVKTEVTSIPGVMEGRRQIDPKQVEGLLDLLLHEEEGVIVCGPIDDPEFSKEVIHLAEFLGYPILADPLSQLRSGHESPQIILEGYDAILRSVDAKNELQPKVVIRFGAMPVSKSTMQFMQGLTEASHIVVDSGGGWRDPSSMSTVMIYGGEAEFCKTISAIKNEIARKSGWLSKWQAMNEIAVRNLQEVKAIEEIDEGKIFCELAKLLPNESALFIGNSMPIRDVDTFFFKTNKNITLYANRGANGIDGVVSSALGASVYNEPMFLVIGDLSFFHDMNGLLAARMNELNLSIILINNNGGGIFSYLPQAQHAKHFEKLFGTPLNMEFKAAGELYGASYAKVNDWNDFEVFVSEAANTKGISIIEVPTDRQKNVQAHRKLWNCVSREISDYLKSVE
ncbi:2-succinyl-5-enolpyruvyl-6-hydroxy-3-cyclohexene-1-carboxylic-acid synthase [Falsibacillus albus]|uniref:2-succinyl-5-enolpyruvyl-6-hydroxy-3-cyclohexene-1-carboxylate synthase n=1 Tax=Falsibacillus albus TaxID=2478915 RepID=A0A3L7K4R6_9BACI|nr:2-succinyl-5-enolpyruvyl-6-hydroxy-3-cyclohexene-1-carboxylic-acid synthase [Falsibacillus albus]RLQ97840.1 2-succinyl-5-enolpyruvyl-6-hydroxy-3-cyclohexene-1-carboxylic-acid synthase [Falsibacillus albus]